jgi:hypothetical protein
MARSALSLLDIETFVAVAQNGSFTRAAMTRVIGGITTRFLRGSLPIRAGSNNFAVRPGSKASGWSPTGCSNVVVVMSTAPISAEAAGANIGVAFGAIKSS